MYHCVRELSHLWVLSENEIGNKNNYYQITTVSAHSKLFIILYLKFIIIVVQVILYSYFVIII